MKQFKDFIDEEANPEVASTYKRIAVQHLKDMMSKGASNSSKIHAKKMHQRALEASKMSNHTDALNHYRGMKEEVEQVKEGYGEDDIAVGGTAIYKHDGKHHMSKVSHKTGGGASTKIHTKSGHVVPLHHVVSTDASDWNHFKDKAVKEEVEQVDELNKKTLASYVSKAAGSYGRDKQLIGRTSPDGTVKSADPDLKRAVKNRLTGINRAAERLAKEEASPMIKAPTNEFGKKEDAFSHAKEHGGKVFKKTFIHPTSGQKNVSYVVRKESVAEGSLNEGQYEMMMRNGQVKKFIAKDDADAKRIAAGHGAKSVIKLKGGVPAGKVTEQSVAEGKKPDRYHIVGKNGKPANLVSYADKASAIKDRDEKHPGAVVQQVGPRGKVKGVTEEVGQIDEVAAWQRKEGKSESGGLNRKGIESYRRENPGSKLSMAVTTKPSKLKPGSKAANRRKSFCARMGGMKKRLTSAKTANDPDSRINKALRKWNC